MKYRNRSAMMGAVVLAPLLVLVLWLASEPVSRCSLYQNVGRIYLAKGTLARSSEQLRAAERWFSSSVVAGCEPASVSLGLGQSYAGLGQSQSAVAALQNGGQRSDLRHFLIGRLYEKMGRSDDAWRVYRALPRDASAHFYRLGARAEQGGDLEEALHDYSVARMINPASPKPYYGAAFIYWRRLEEDEKAVEMARQGLAVDTRPSVERDFYQGLLCYYENNNGCATAAWVSATRERTQLDPTSNHRRLAYEMLSQVLSERGWRNLRTLAMVTREAAAQ